MKRLMTALAAAMGVTASAWAATATVSGKTWWYDIEGTGAVIVDEEYGVAVSPVPSGALTIPSKLGGKPVTAIGDCAFMECDGLTKATLPSTVTEIRDRAFSECRSLVSVNWPSGLTRIGIYAFENCEKLSSVTIRPGVAIIESGAFSGCESITSVSIPGSVVKIEDEAFYCCVSVNNLSIANGVQTIGAGAFCFCESLESVTVPDSVTSIGDNAFFGCMSLKSIVLPGRFKGSLVRIMGDYDEEYLSVKFSDGSANVSFNANGGSVTPASRSVASGAAVGTLPTPTWGGHTFNGWYTAKTGGTKISASTKVTKSVTYYAQWTLKQYKLTFNANGGTVSPAYKMVGYCKTCDTFPTPTWGGHTFKGWYTARTGGTKVTSPAKCVGNATLYARW